MSAPQPTQPVNRVQAVIFDLDGLLIDSEPIWQDTEVEVFQRIGVPLTHQLCSQTMGMILHEVIDHWAERHPWDEERHPRSEVAERVMLGVIERMRTQGRPLPGVQETIQFLQERSVPLAVASSSYARVIDAALEALQIRDSFQIVRSAEHEALGKPHPGVFLSTAADLGIDPTRCLVFEDSVMGLVAAKAARMLCVAVPDSSRKNDPRYSLADLCLDSLLDFNADAWQKLNAK